MTRRTLRVVWGVGPSGAGKLARGDADRILQLDILEGFLPDTVFRHTFLLVPLPERYPPKTSVKVWLILWTAKCTLERPSVPLEVVVGIGWRRALYNKRYRNDLPCLEKSDMKSPKFDISAFFASPILYINPNKTANQCYSSPRQCFECYVNLNHSNHSRIFACQNIVST